MRTNSLSPQLFHRNDVFENVSWAKYERHVDCAESVDDSCSTDSLSVFETINPDSKCHREVYFAFLSKKYQPLRGQDEQKEKEKKMKYKKMRKNVRKALKCTWKCLMLGLYNFALGYSTPMFVTSTFSPDLHQEQS